MFNRRDLLKLFGAGTVIAPVVDGLTSESARATLIEVPKIEIAEPPAVVLASEIEYGDYDATVYLHQRSTNKTIRWDCTLKAMDLKPLLIKHKDYLFRFDDRHRRRGE